MASIVSNFVEVVVFRRTARMVSYLLLRRSVTETPFPGIWQVVSGRRRGKETAAETAIREVFEETGLEPREMWVLPFVNTFYTTDGDAVHAVPTFAAEVPNTARVVLSSEHSDCTWVSRRRAESIVQWPAHLTMMDLVTEYVLKDRGSVHKVRIKDLRKESK